MGDGAVSDAILRGGRRPTVTTLVVTQLEKKK